MTVGRDKTSEIVKSERPKSMINFGRALYVVLAFKWIQLFVVGLPDESKDAGRLIGSALFLTIYIPLIVYFVVHRRSAIAAWVYIAVTVCGLPLVLLGVLQGRIWGMPGLAAAGLAFEVWALYNLFHPSSLAWWKSKAR